VFCGDVVGVDCTTLCSKWSSQQLEFTLQRWSAVPCSEIMAARTGWTSGKVMDERAMKAWMKARLASLYSTSSMLQSKSL
jgi:hypothetical protein